MLGVLSPLLTIGRSVPQVTRVFRSGADGVSSATWIMLVVLAELWAIYGFLARVPAEVATNLPNGLLCLLVVLLVAWRRGTLRPALFVLGALSTLIAAFAVACAVGKAENVEAVVTVVALSRSLLTAIAPEPDQDRASWFVAGQLGPYGGGGDELDDLWPRHCQDP